jgi:tetratricopeptide (TPR) repeat protein
MNTADQSVKSFIQKVYWMMTYRTALKWAWVWLLVMGVALLVIRFTSELPADWWHTALMVAVLSFVPLIGAAAYVEYRRRPDLEQMRAAFDSENHAGGLVMAAAEVDTRSWEAKTANLNLPSIHWRGSRAWAGVCLTLIFLLAAFLVPLRWASLISDPPLEVGQQVQQLQEQINVLEEENVITPDEAEITREQLEHIAEEASGFNPSKTLADLDHLLKKHQNLAQQEASEALSKMDALNEAELLGKALELVPEGLADEKALEEALKKFGDLLGELKEQGALDPEKMPPEMQEALREAMEELMKQAHKEKGGPGMDPKQMEQLMEVLGQNKEALMNLAKKLKDQGLIPPDMAKKMMEGMKGMDPGPLAELMKQGGLNPGELEEMLEAFREMQLGGMGEPNRGPGPAPMMFGNPSSDDGTDFLEQKLAPNAPLDKSMLQGVTQDAPEVTGGDAVLSSGALSQAGAGGGSAITAPTLPRHRGAVYRFNKRTGQDK